MTSALGGSVTAPKSQNGSFPGSVGVVDVERRPAVVPRLHPEHPCDRAVGRPGADPGASQRHHDDGGVVDVGIVVVRELEREAAGGEVRPAHRPVALDVHLARDEPLGRPADRVVTLLEPCVEQRDQRKRGVPHGRLAGLDPAALFVLDRERVEPGERSLEHRMVEREPERVQRDHRPDPRRLDAAPRAVPLLPVDDPLDGAVERDPPERAEWVPPVGVQDAVEQRPGRRPAAVELVDPERHRAHRLQRRRDLKRDDRLPGPAAERVDRERCAGGEEHLLRREHRDQVPAPEPEQREPHAREDAGRLEPTELRGPPSASVACAPRRARRPRAAARRTPRPSSTGRPGRRSTWPRSRPRAGASESSGPSRAPSARPAGRDSGAGTDPLRRSSRSSRARPSSSRPGAGARAGARLRARAPRAPPRPSSAVWSSCRLPPRHAARGLAERRCRRGTPAAHGALHRRRPARVGPGPGEVDAREARTRAGPKPVRARHAAERRPRLARDVCVQQGRAPDRREELRERRQVLLDERLLRQLDLARGVRERDRRRAAPARHPTPRSGRRPTGQASRRRPRRGARERAGRSAGEG